MHTDMEAVPDVKLTEAERKRLKRQEKNRTSAAKSRKRASDSAKETLERLNQALLLVEQLTAENARLRACSQVQEGDGSELFAENARLRAENDSLKMSMFSPELFLDG